MQTCLSDILGAYKKYGDAPTFQCFNVGGDANSAVKGMGKGGMWLVGGVWGLGVLSLVVGSC